MLRREQKEIGDRRSAQSQLHPFIIPLKTSVRHVEIAHNLTKKGPRRHEPPMYINTYEGKKHKKIT